MKKLYTILLLSFTILFATAQSPKNLHSYSAVTIKDDTVDLKKYYGKKVLVVNTASYCGYTYEFAHLQSLYSQYKKYNFEIIGFPCNDFGSQDPNSDSLIFTFCTDNYGVTFQMMSKIAIVSRDTAEVYKWLMRKELNGVANAAVTWNFHKYLIDEAGNWVRHFDSPVSPLDTAITNWIKSPSVLPNRVVFTSEHQVATDDHASFTEQGGIATDINATGTLPAIVWRSANPTATAFELAVYADYKKLSMKIYTADGRYIANMYEGAATNSQQISYPVADLPSGMYIIAIVADGKQQTVKYAVTR